MELDLAISNRELQLPSSSKVGGDEPIAEANPSVEEVSAHDEVNEPVSGAASANVPSRFDLSEAVGRINEYAKIHEVGVLLELHDDSEQMIVKVIDRNTDEVLRQIPSEHALAMAEHLNEIMDGFFKNETELKFGLLHEKV